MALTATATPVVRADICAALKLSDPLISCTSFDRYFKLLNIKIDGYRSIDVIFIVNTIACTIQTRHSCIT